MNEPSEPVATWMRAYREWEDWGTNPTALATAGDALVQHATEVEEALTGAMEAVVIWQERALIAEAQVRSLNDAVNELLRAAA